MNGKTILLALWLSSACGFSQAFLLNSVGGSAASALPEKDNSIFWYYSTWFPGAIYTNTGASNIIYVMNGVRDTYMTGSARLTNGTHFALSNASWTNLAYYCTNYNDDWNIRAEPGIVFLGGGLGVFEDAVEFTTSGSGATTVPISATTSDMLIVLSTNLLFFVVDPLSDETKYGSVTVSNGSALTLDTEAYLYEHSGGFSIISNAVLYLESGESAEIGVSFSQNAARDEFWSADTLIIPGGTLANVSLVGDVTQAPSISWYPESAVFDWKEWLTNSFSGNYAYFAGRASKGRMTSIEENSGDAESISGLNSESNLHSVILNGYETTLDLSGLSGLNFVDLGVSTVGDLAMSWGGITNFSVAGDNWTTSDLSSLACGLRYGTSQNNGEANFEGTDLNSTGKNCLDYLQASRNWTVSYDYP